MNNRLGGTKQLLSAGCVLLRMASTFRLSAQGYQTTYKEKDNNIVGQNTGRYNNRPVYSKNTNAFILAGDQPIARLVKDQNLSWKLNVMGQPELLIWSFVPEECQNNSVEINNKSFFVPLSVDPAEAYLTYGKF